MPEGDTIYRTATVLRQWLAARPVTAVHSRVTGLAAGRLVGATVTEVESKGKHLLIRFSTGDTLHTHMRMTGSWHVYQAGERWRRPRHQARLVLEAGDRVAVCFNAPVVELLVSRAEGLHPVLAALGEDLLGDGPLDVDAARGRARHVRGEMGERPAVGEVLLDQRVVAGIGNIYRCETLFLCGIDPWAPVDILTDGELDQLLTTGARLLRAAAAPAAGPGAGPRGTWVYRRAGLPCRRCGAPVSQARLGRQARTVYWCAGCQPRRAVAAGG